MKILPGHPWLVFHNDEEHSAGGAFDFSSSHATYEAALAWTRGFPGAFALPELGVQIVDSINGTIETHVWTQEAGWVAP